MQALRELGYDTTWARAAEEALTYLAISHRFDVPDWPYLTAAIADVGPAYRRLPQLS